jgi:hypothetical protein
MRNIHALALGMVIAGLGAKGLSATLVTFSMMEALLSLPLQPIKLLSAMDPIPVPIP